MAGDARIEMLMLQHKLRHHPPVSHYQMKAQLKNGLDSALCAGGWQAVQQECASQTGGIRLSRAWVWSEGGGDEG
eukprot:CAMPEP_0175339288 /NCGR_PEP_ID=MMETSP0095-20121207/5260_1 /TAXON_ID=311494 /ORGANISM="Alexandrium monilatum, Strain CCMP3105" /LENGTH=74 /DNA_ID=CAMNT_0016636691 /DNA_START=43 /DNA_END=264 /DNA_ORIENTATION=-